MDLSRRLHPSVGSVFLEMYSDFTMQCGLDNLARKITSVSGTSSWCCLKLQYLKSFDFCIYFCFDLFNFILLFFFIDFDFFSPGLFHLCSEQKVKLHILALNVAFGKIKFNQSYFLFYWLEPFHIKLKLYDLVWFLILYMASVVISCYKFVIYSRLNCLQTKHLYYVYCKVA
jgi:hypothetical protein